MSQTFTILFTVFLYFLVNIVSQPVMPYERIFQWQVHSFNDKRELTQLLKKGTTLFKIDLYYQQHSKCYTKDSRSTKDKRGCFILTHDKPQSQVSYDSIYDYLDEIIKHKAYFINNSYTISIALCFKNTPNICNGWNNNWLALVDDLYKLMEKIIKENNLQIEFIYDGKKEKCIRDKWPQWNYTWIGGNDPAEAFTSDDKEKGYNKFAIFNDAEIDLKRDALLNWGKFRQKQRPLQVWQPNNQEPILSVANIFTDHPHSYGYAYAINIDTSMYQIYTAPVSKENFNENLIKDKSVSMEKSAFAIVLKDNGKFVYLFIGGRDNPLLSIYQIVSKNIILIKSMPLPSSNDTCIKEVIYLGNNSVLNNRDYFIVRGINEFYCIYELDQYSIVKAKCGLLFSIVNEHYTLSSFSLLNFNTQSQSALILISYVIDETTIKFAVVSIDFNGSLNVQLAFKILKPLLVNQSIQEINVKCNNGKCLLLYNFSTNSTIRSNIIHLNLENKAYIIKEYKSFGLGKHFSLSLVNHNSNLKFLIVKDNGFCYHNEPSNKDASILMCDQKEIEIPHVLNYIHGNIQNEYDTTDNASSVCSKETITGSYDMGDYPHVSSFIICNNNDDPSTCNYEFYELHNGINETTRDIHKQCGVSRYYEGIVFDSWQMLSLVK